MSTLSSTEQLDSPEKNEGADPFEVPPGDPIALLGDWLADARQNGVRDPGALALATVDRHGRASNRIVQVLTVTDSGLLFTSHAGSGKGHDLAQNNWASGVWYWRESSRQLISSGPVERMTDQESDALWAARPASTYPMSVASQQSAPLDDEAELRGLAEDLAQQAEAGHELARPDAWSGYRLRPDTVEFWQGSPDRLHRRLRYHRSGTGWTSQRLQP